MKLGTEGKNNNQKGKEIIYYSIVSSLKKLGADILKT